MADFFFPSRGVLGTSDGELGQNRPSRTANQVRSLIFRAVPRARKLTCIFQQSLAHVDARPRGRRGWETDVRETRGAYASVNLNTKVRG